jgi:GNAT superfamily N-acetyltransferase
VNGLSREALTPLGHDPAALRAFEAHGVAQQVVESTVRDGAAYSFRGRPLLITTDEDGITGTQDVYVGFLHPGLSAPAALRALRDAVLGQWPGADRILIRDCEPRPSPRQGPFRALLRYVCKPAERCTAPEGCDIRPVDARTLGFVLDLLAKAFVNGYAAQGREVAPDTALRFVTREYRQALRSGQASALVAWEDGEPVAQATWLPDCPDDLWPRRFHEIVDIYVLDAARRRGLGTALLHTLERKAADDRATLLGNVVAEPGNSQWQQVYARLRDLGWQPAYDILVARGSSLDDHEGR